MAVLLPLGGGVTLLLGEGGEATSGAEGLLLPLDGAEAAGIRWEAGRRKKDDMALPGGEEALLRLPPSES